MGHDKCKTEKLNDSELLSLFILLGIESKETEILSNIFPLNKNADKLKDDQKGLEVGVTKKMSHYHEQSSKKKV